MSTKASRRSTVKKSRADGLVRGAALRAAIQSVLANASNSLPARAIRESEPVKATGIDQRNFEQTLYRMTKNKQVERVGEPGGYVYNPVTNNYPLLVKEARAAKVVKAAKIAPQGEVKVDIDRANGRLRIEVIGNLVLNLGLK
jgi:hypothetical protein